MAGLIALCNGIDYICKPHEKNCQLLAYSAHHYC